jgi:hypothetical protein
LTEDIWGNGDRKRQSFIRWQQVTGQQFSNVVNLLLALSSASIGFEISTYLNSNFSITSCEKFLYLSSLVFLSLSVCFGLCASATRLFDFRYTTRLARTRWKEATNLSKIECLEETTRRLGSASWLLFGAQSLMFALGVLAVAIVYFKFILG